MPTGSFPESLIAAGVAIAVQRALRPAAMVMACFRRSALRRGLASQTEPFDRARHGKPSWSLRASLNPGKAAERPSLSPEQLKKIATLSNLEVESAAQLAALHRDVTAIVGWIGQISDVKTDGVAPLLSPAESEPLRLRADDASERADAAAVLRNARHKDKGFFVVPKVVDSGD